MHYASGGEYYARGKEGGGRGFFSEEHVFAYSVLRLGLWAKIQTQNYLKSANFFSTILTSREIRKRLIMIVYLVRHGESEANSLHMHDGQGYSPLTEKGISDAKRVGTRLAGIAFDKVFSSDQVRAIQTAREALPGIEPVQDARIREIDVGILTRRLVADCEKEFGEEYLTNKRHRDFTPYGGESSQMQYDRCADFMKTLESLPDCRNVAVFAHGGSIRCMLGYVLGFYIGQPQILFANGSVTVLMFENGKWCLKIE